MPEETREGNMKRYRQQFIDTGEMHSDVPQIVADSWRRCRENHLEKNIQVERLSEAELNQLLEQNKELLGVAHPTLCHLVEMVLGTQYAVTLHAPNGIIMDVLLAGENSNFHSSSHFRVGVKWDERSIGTCSSSVAVDLNTAVQLVGYEHYNENLTTLVGTAAPIHDGNGNIIACLNMCGFSNTRSPHTLGLVASMAQLVEKQMRISRARVIINDIFDNLSDGIVVLDRDYRPKYLNFHATVLFRLPQKQLYEQDFRTFFQKEDFEERLEQERNSFTYKDYELAVNGKTLRCNVSITPMYVSGTRTGAILNFRDSRSANRAANRGSGNHSNYTFDDIITQDEEIKRQISMMKHIANTDCCVLIEGESGTGKELFSHAIHSESDRRKGPFIAVNCAALPRGLVESELFGYEKGAFTGARSDGNPGKFELADGGTIFLDEVGELPLEVQALLLRVLDNHRVTRIGGKEEKELDVRVVAATNRDLYKEVENGNFRRDLYFRISVLKFDIPPLRVRGRDIRLLSQLFLDQMNGKTDSQPKYFTEDFLTAMENYDWPGNVRELQNMVARSYYTSQEPAIKPDILPHYMVKTLSPKPSIPSAAGILADSERELLGKLLLEYRGDIDQVGAHMKLSKATVYRRMKKYGITLK